ncbi:MAG: hypothetical protein L6R36_008693, partial [Xanthoria steineri]
TPPRKMANGLESTDLDNPVGSPARPLQPGLGNFGFLPPEIRSKIWQEYFNLDSPARSTCDTLACSAQRSSCSPDAFPAMVNEKRKVSILRTSGQLYRETIGELYHHRNLSICFDRDHRDHGSTAPNWETIFHTTMDGICISRDFCHTDFSRFESISLFVQIPPNTDFRKPSMDDLNLEMIWEGFKRFCLLVRQCQCSKPSQHVPWPTFDVTVRVEQDTLGGSDPDYDYICCVVVLLYVLRLLVEMTILESVDLQHTTVNVDLKLRSAEEFLNEIRWNKAESGRQGPRLTCPFDEPDDAAEEETSPVTLHLRIHAYGTVSGVPAYEIITPDFVCYTVPCEYDHPKRRLYRGAPLVLG